MERKKITFYDPDEIANLKAQLAEYIELGTPDELAKALAASKESYYPILVDKYMDIRRRFISVKTENAKLKQIIESLNIKIEEKDREYREKNRNGIKVQVISNPQIDRTAEQLVQEATALRHELDYANYTIDQLEAKLKQREQVAAKRKETIALLKSLLEHERKDFCERVCALTKGEQDES